MASLDDEPSSMKTAYLFLKYLDEGAQRRSLDWIVARLAEDRRGREAKERPGTQPSTWFTDPACDGFPDREDALEDADANAWDIIELFGSAVVHQEFVVMVPVDEGAGGGFEAESFATRALAEEYVAAMRPDEAKDATAFEAYLQALEAGGAHVDRADPENEGMWRRHFDAGKPASDFVPAAGDDEAFRQWLAKVLLLGGRVYHDGDDDVPIWRDLYMSARTPEEAVELAAMNR